MDFNEKLEYYAKLTVKLGVNVKKDKYVLISCPVHAAEFGRRVASEAYDAGAKDVVMLYYDESFSKLRYRKADVSCFECVPEWQAEQRNHYARMGCASISVLSENPDGFEGISGEKLLKNTRARRKAFKEYYDYMDRGDMPWTIVAYPCASWARKMFPGKEDDEAIQLLWDAIFETVRIKDEDPLPLWAAHDKELKKHASLMNEYAFSYLEYKNSIGTDLKVGLPKGHIWAGGSETSNDGIVYIPNMPTEEIFTLPDRLNVEGKLTASMPLSYQGNLIEDFYLVFEGGKVVSFGAKKGEDTLKRLLDTDEGTRRLGEVALIPFDSPIRKLGILFYNTLFDENASCHFALGECYPMSLEGGINMSDEELSERGGNRSVEHVDFMIGTKDLSITGVKEDGTRIPVFKDGNFTF